MIRWLRNILFRSLSTRAYLLLVSRVYLVLVRLRLVKRQYPELFFTEQLVRPGAYCIDIGANLGYYTVHLSRCCGPEGRVWAVEPVPLFARILEKNVAVFGAGNVTLVPHALGPKQETVQMGTPEIAGVFRHGCTRVLDEAAGDHAEVYDVSMCRPDVLFAELDRLDFVKCDVEGYETTLFPHFTETLRRHRPVVQVEINTPAKRCEMIELMGRLGYRAHALRAGRLVALTTAQARALEGHDFYFLPEGPTS